MILIEIVKIFIGFAIVIGFVRIWIGLVRIFIELVKILGY